MICVNLDVAQKDVKDKHCSETNFRIGDRVWFFNPASSEGWSDIEVLFTVERALYYYRPGKSSELQDSVDWNYKYPNSSLQSVEALSW